jgi:hypothetical protein
MEIRPELRTKTVSRFIESPVRPVISGYWLVEVEGPTGILWFVRLLCLVASMSQVMVEQAGKEFVNDDCFHRGSADVNLAPVPVRSVHDRLGSNLRLNYLPR